MAGPNLRTRGEHVESTATSAYLTVALRRSKKRGDGGAHQMTFGKTAGLDLRSAQTDALRALRPIDCDLHVAPPSMKDFLPYLKDHSREAMVTRGINALDLAAYPPKAPISARPDWRDA